MQPRQVVIGSPFFIDHGAHPSLQLSAPTDRLTVTESPADYECRMRQMEQTVLDLMLVAQWDSDSKGKLDEVRFNRVFKVGGRVC